MARVLLIDDQPNELQTLGDWLWSEGHDVVTATSLDQARALFEAEERDFLAVLLDWNLTGEGSVEAFLAADPADSVEIVLKADDFDREQLEGAIERGAYFFVVRPFNDLQLRTIIQAAVRSAELKRTLARKVEDIEDTFYLLRKGEFTFQTPRQAELLAVNLGSASGDAQAGVGILELMLNAVEHGNLEITFEEKSRLLLAGKFREEVARRLALPEYQGRHAQVRVERDEHYLELTITDQGSGFDFQRFLVPDPDRMLAPNGRGVLMACTALKMRYREPGNEVWVQVPIAGRAAPS